MITHTHQPLQHSGRAGQQSDYAGFTLVEILVVVALFALTMLLATSIFLLSTRSQRQGSLQQKLQGDLRYTLEAIARDVKYGTIDYSCYTDDDISPCLPVETNGKYDTRTAKPSAMLALTDTQGNRTIYLAAPSPVGVTYSVYGGYIIQVCKITAGVDIANKCTVPSNWQPVTPTGLELTIMSPFLIFPSADPYAQSGSTTGSPYSADIQPYVTISLQMREVGSLTKGHFPGTGALFFITDPSQVISGQTTVSSRYYVR